MKADSNLMEENLFENSNGLHVEHSMENGTLDSMPSEIFIPGEELIVDSEIEFGKIKLTNYRIIIRKILPKWISIPLKSIESLEVISSTIKILCKDVKIIEFTFLCESQCTLWETRLQDRIKPLADPLDAFAVEFYAAIKAKFPTIFDILKGDSLSYKDHMEMDFHKEFERLGFKDSKVWRISKINENYQLCETYPRHVIVPTYFIDEDLPAAAEFRVNRRLPTPVWRHKNGAVLARSSQPAIGIFSNRSVTDERLLNDMSQACGIFSDMEENDSDIPTESSGLITERKKLLVVDCRTFAAAVANRVRGGGYENIINYKSADLRHMNIPNIHNVQLAYTNLRTVLFNLTDESKRLLKNEDWYDTISNIIFSALVASEALDTSRPVLVHCSDGWDRTPQITSLTAILLDPFYRTIRGFQTLVEREFIEFGHKFGERNEVVLKPGGEKCPVFLQFLECVYQLIVQFPTEFEFNNEFLMKLGQHIYSNLFGDFLFNTSGERTRAEIRNKTFSVWCIFKLNRERFVNILYKPECETIKPSAFSVNLVIWKSFYTWCAKFLPMLSEDIVRTAAQSSDVEPKRIKSCPALFDRPNAHDQDFEVVEIEDVINGLKLENRSRSYDSDCNLTETDKAQINGNASTNTNNVLTEASESPSKTESFGFVKEQLLSYANSLSADSGNKSVPANIDGLNFIEGDQERTLLEKSVREAKIEVDALQLQLKKIKELNQKFLKTLNKASEIVEEQDIAGLECQGQDCASDASWEDVEPADKPPTWEDANTALFCMDCNRKFWEGVRKHHCRNCGKVFCDKCLRNRLIVPKENLPVPVRICRRCVEHHDSPPRSPPMAVSN